MEGLATSLEELSAREQGSGQQATGVAEEGGTQAAQGAAPEAEGTPPVTEAPQSVDWLTELNKSFGTQYKSADEVKSIFELPSKVKEYETEMETLKASAENEKVYKKKIQELESSLNPLTHFSSKEAYIAEQLRKQHPDKNQSLLQDVATKDLSQMDALDVLINAVMLNNPDITKEEAQDWVYDKYVIDPDVPRDEWSAGVKSKVKIAANEARKELNTLKSSIALPEILTEEQAEQRRAEGVEKLKKQIKPLADKFAQFDKFQRQVGDNSFEFVVPDDYKAGLPTMFEEFFVKGGAEVNEESLSAISELRDSLMVYRNFDNVYRAIESDVSARIKKEYDEILGNTPPPNQATAPEQTDGLGLPSIKDFIARY